MTGTPTNNPQPKKLELSKGVTIAGSGTGIAILINWIYKMKVGEEMPSEVAIVLAGILTFVAGRVWNLIDQFLEKRGYDVDGDD